MAARIIFISHASTQALRRAAFPLDEPIGASEAAKIAALRWSAPRAESIWSAPEQRALQTAGALGLTATVSDELRDCDYGSWRGRTMDEVQAEDPEGIFQWLSDPGAAPHGGESVGNLIARVGRWMESQGEIRTVIAVTHATVIRAALVYALRISTPTFWRFDVAPLTLTDLRFSRNLWTLRCVGCALRQHGTCEDDDAEV